MMASQSKPSSVSPLRGQRRPGAPRGAFLLPVELRRVNHTTSTNGADFIREYLRKPYN
jgi:hypothetical protein